MKFSLLFVAILGVAAVSAVPTGKVVSRPTRDLNDHLHDFLALLPLTDMLEVCMNYLAEDAEVQALVEWALSGALGALIEKILLVEEIIEFIEWLEENGIPCSDWMDVVSSVIPTTLTLAAKSASATRLASVRITGGVKGFFQDILALLPIDEITALHKSKMESSEDYVALMDVIKSDKCRSLYERAMANETVQSHIATIESYGFDVSAIATIAKALLGWV